MSGLIRHDDEELVRWVAMLLIEGKKESEIRRTLTQDGLFDSRLAPDAWKKLLLAGMSEATSMRSLVISKAELGSTDWLRLDSYQRRKNNLKRMERIIEKAEADADSISKLNTVSFMSQGLVKAQDSMDSFTGAKEAKPQVQINIGYDPLDQFRSVIQAESSTAGIGTVIEVDPQVESIEDDSEE